MIKHSSDGGLSLFTPLGAPADGCQLPADRHAAVGTLVGDVGRRTPAEDRRIATHEASHAFTARFSGLPLGGATIEPGPGYSGLVWGPQAEKSRYSDEVVSLCERLAPLMPGPGESHAVVSEMLTHAHLRILELVSGSVGEKMLLGDTPLRAGDDRRQEQAYAGIICRSPGAVSTYLEFARIEAAALIAEHRSVVVELANELLARRTLTGDEIDQIISRTLAVGELDGEKARRTAWQECISSAAAFEANHVQEPLTRTSMLLVRR